MYRSICLAVLAAGTAAPAWAQPADAPRLSLTIYNSDLALVQEQRTLNVPAGRTRLEFKDVSASIRPETVALTAKGVSIVEQNFDYDLLTPAKLMEKAVGQQVQIVRTNPGNGAAGDRDRDRAVGQRRRGAAGSATASRCCATTACPPG